MIIVLTLKTEPQTAAKARFSSPSTLHLMQDAATPPEWPAV